MSADKLPREIRVSQAATPPVSEDLKLRAKQALAAAVGLSRKLYGRNFLMPTISFDLRGSTAGKAFPGKFHVQLNAQLYIENVDIFLKDTIVHEWAHIVAHALHRGTYIKPHGPEWQRVMRELGVPPTRCHRMDTTHARVHKLYDYRCKCKEYKLTSIRHGYAQSGRYSYRCPKCNNKLTWADAAATVPGAASTRAREAPPSAAPGPVATALQSSQSSAPTPRQLQYAMHLARTHGLQLPDEALSFKAELSAWISRALKQLG